MRLRYTLLLALILIGLGAFLYFVESPRMAEEAKKQTLVELNPDDVSSIELVYADRDIALEKSDTGWRLTKPVEAAADDITVKNLLRAIADAEVKKTIDDPPQDLAQFGLAPPVATVKISVKGQPLPEIKVGKTTAVSFSTYVQRADQPKIYLTASAFNTGMDKQVKDLRDKKILDFQDDAITRLSLRSADGEVVLAKQDGNWQIEQPAAYRADSNAVRAMLSTLRNLRATDFASEAPSDADLTTYGLDAPERVLTLTSTDGKDIRLLVGKEVEQGIYVKTADRPTTFVVGKFVSRDLSKGVGDLRDKTVFSFDPANATSIEVTRGSGGHFTLRSAAGKWSLDGSDQSLNEQAVGTFVAALSRLSGNTVLAEAPDDLGAYGLAAPALTITVKGKDDAPIGTVLAGTRSPEPPAIEHTVKRDGEPTVFQLRDFQFEQLDKEPADFLNEPDAPPPQ